MLDELLKDVSMHVAAASPRFLASGDIDESLKKEKQRFILSNLKSKVSLSK